MNPPRFVKVDTAPGEYACLRTTGGGAYLLDVCDGIEAATACMSIEELRKMLALFPEIHGPETEAARDLINAVAKVRASVPQNTPVEIAFHAAWNAYMATVKP